MPEPEDSSESIRLSAIRQTIAKNRVRDHGKFVKKESTAEFSSQKAPQQAFANIPPSNPFFTLTHTINPLANGEDEPMVNVNVGAKVRNPLDAITNLLKKIFNNEGFEWYQRLRMKPLTAFLVASAIVSGGGLGISFVRYLENTNPVLHYISTVGNSPAQEGVFSGHLQLVNGIYYLVTAIGQPAIKLTIPTTLDRGLLVGHEVLVTGLYYEDRKEMNVTGIQSVQ
jgi:hypothetical protein